MAAAGEAAAAATTMTAARLAGYAELDRRRRAEALPAAARLIVGFPLAAIAGLLAAAGLALLARRHGAGEARAWWAVLSAFATAGIVMRAPFRMYWRSDATLLARLPISGEALFGLAARRSARAAAQVALALLLAAVPVAFAGLLAGAGAGGDPGAGGGAAAAGAGLGAGVLALARFVVVIGGACAAAALLTPPVGALAGALVADDKLQRTISSMAGEASGPPLVWLSFLPALGGLVAFGIAWFSAPWAALGREAAGLVAAAVLGGALAVAGLVWLAARRRLAAALPMATREVAALDAVKLATLQLDTARGLEALWGRVVAGGGTAGAVYRKDVALARRRHPMFFLLAGLGLLVLWLLAAFAAPETRERWSLGVGIGLAVYLAIFGRRLARAPIERARLLATLPLPPAAVARAKWTFVLWRAVFIAVALAPAVYRAPDPAPLAAQLAAIVAAAAIAAGVMTRRRRNDVATDAPEAG